MCTAIAWHSKDHYFGRTLDYHMSYGECVTVTPRNYPLHFLSCGALNHHFAIIGMAHLAEGHPLYYDATNEKGLSAAALNFPGFARYHPPAKKKHNIASYELIPWILAQCSSLAEAKTLLPDLNITNRSFREDLPATPLHWMLADRTGSLVLESTRQGLQVHQNPVGVMTNSPPFPYHMLHLAQYRHLSPNSGKNRLTKAVSLPAYSLGMGALGLPGDLSSPSRFVRCAFTRLNSLAGDTEEQNVAQFFHILGTVSQPRGCTRLNTGEYEHTQYTGCCNTDRGIYYYTTYYNPQITAVDMHRTDLDTAVPISYPLIAEPHIHQQN